MSIVFNISFVTTFILLWHVILKSSIIFVVKTTVPIYLFSSLLSYFVINSYICNPDRLYGETSRPYLGGN